MYQSISIENLPLPPPRMWWEIGHVNGDFAHAYVWVRGRNRHGAATAFWCIDQYHDDDRRLLWRVEEKGAWNKPMDNFYGYESAQQAAQALINYIVVAVDLNNLEGD